MSYSNRWLVQRIPTALLVLLIGFASGCARQRAIEGVQPAPPEPVHMRVYNNHSLDVNVYVVLNNAWYRLGTVTSCSTASFDVRPAMIGLTRFQIGLDPIGSAARHVLDVTSLAPGETIELVVQNHLPHSFWLMVNKDADPAR